MNQISPESCQTPGNCEPKKRGVQSEMEKSKGWRAACFICWLGVEQLMLCQFISASPWWWQERCAEVSFVAVSCVSLSDEGFYQARAAPDSTE